MPERRDDPNKTWTYETKFPGADYRVNQAAVTRPHLVEATGLDGRFLGALRPFPGMADITIHGVPTPTASVTTVESLDGVEAAWYVAIQKGISGYAMRGIVYLADNPNDDGVGKALYFAFRDDDPTPEHGQGSDLSYDVVMLEDFNDWDDFKLTDILEYDVTSMGRYIYFVASGSTTSPVAAFSGKEPPYNKAYFWDWKINDWDRYRYGGEKWDGRFMSIMPQRLMSTQLNAGGIGPVLETGDDARTDQTATVSLVNGAVDLSDVSDASIHTLVLYGRSDGNNGSNQFTITGVDDVNDTVDVTPTPSTTDTGICWAIRGTETDAGVDAFKVDPSVQSGTEIEPPGPRTYACELISRKHNLRSYLRIYSKWEDRTLLGTRAYSVDRVQLPQVTYGSDTHQIQGPSATSAIGVGCLTNWGMTHVDGFRFYRSQFSRIGAAEDFEETPGGSDEDALDHYEPLGMIFVTKDYEEKGIFDPANPIPNFTFNTWIGTHATIENEIPFFTDEALIQQIPYDVFLDAFGPAPRMKRITAYDGLLVGITDVAQPSVLTDNWDEVEQRPEELAWSTLVNQEPENFPAENRYPTDDAGEKFFCLEHAGDHLFGVSAKGIYRVTRSGEHMALTRMAFRLGGVSRWGQTGVDNVLFIVTKAGVKSIDGNSGAIKSISAMDRIICDDREWAGSLDSVILEYDATIGALIFLNTTEKEAIILWEATGAVTRLVDCPWSFLVGGPNVLTNGPQRAYFVMDDGTVSCIDGAREMGKRTMCGTGSSETVNGTVTAGTDADTIKDSTATFPANIVGHRVYIRSGDYKDEDGLVTTRVSATELTLDATDKLSGSPAVGDRYSIAPVITEVVLSQLEGDGDVIDPFVRKVGTAISIAFSRLGGETDSDDDNAEVRMGFQKGLQPLTWADVALNATPDSCVGRVNTGDTRLYPYLKFYGSNQDWEMQAVLVHGLLGLSEAQTRQS